MNYKSEIAQIKELYPEERIRKSKERYKAIWDLKTPSDRIPFAFWWYPFNSGFDVEGLDLLDKEKRLQYLILQIKAKAGLDDDYIPGLWSEERPPIIAAAFGCELVHERSTHFWTKPIINSPKDVYKLKILDLKHQGLTKEALENTKYYRKMTYGKLPIYLCDMQGPLSLASLMWNYQDLLMALLTNPKEVHALLRLLTEAIIKFLYLMIEASEGDIIPLECFPFAWMPMDKGVSVSDDLLAILSPEQYKEFNVPYLQQIADEFGGLVIHSCGNFSHNLENLSKIKNLVGINFGSSEMPIEEIVEKMDSRYVLLTHRGIKGQTGLYSGKDHIDAVMPTFRKGVPGCIFFDYTREFKDENELKETCKYAIKECVLKK